MNAAFRAMPPADEVTPLSGEVFGALINLSGRRRFTSQRVVLYAVLAFHGHAGAAAIASEALTLFRDAHALLIKGDRRLPGVFCPELEQAYFGKPDADRKIRQFIALTEQTIAAIVDGASAERPLAELVNAATPLLEVLNELTAIYEEQSKRHAVLMKKRLRSVIDDIETIAKQAKMIAFNARIVAARAGHAGKEFAVVAGVLSTVTAEIDEMVSGALIGALKAA
jgi:hypothetical protein